MGQMSTLVFAPGFFHSGAVGVAVAVGGAVAVVSACVGVFTVIRGQSFAGHALSDVATTGGSGAFVLGVSPLTGYVVLGLAAAAAMDLVGIQRARGRDVATGIVLGAGLGLSALFLYFDTTMRATTGATMTILFGSMFAISSSTIPLIAVLAAVALGVTALVYRPLMLSSLDQEIARAAGVPVRLVGVLYLLGLAIAVALSAVTIGAILSTALLVGPAATALRISRRPATALALASLIGVGSVWLGIVLAYDSFYWPPRGHGWPVSFFVVTLVFVFYLFTEARVLHRLARSRAALARLAARFAVHRQARIQAGG